MIFHAPPTVEANPGCKPDDFVRSFLFGTAGVGRDGQSPRSVLVMDEKTQGRVGSPHGGIAMGAMTDLAFALIGDADGPLRRHIQVLFWASGGTAAVHGDGTLKPVVGASPCRSHSPCFPASRSIRLTEVNLRCR